MKQFMGVVMGLLIFCGISGELHAGAQDVAITATKKKVDESKNSSGTGIYVETSQIVYTVTVQNKAFKELRDITIKYMVFYEKANLGEKEQPGEVSLKGQEVIPVLGRGETTKFETRPLSLKSASLESGWHFRDGSKNQVKERVSGVWFRAYSGETLIGEYANPSSMTTRVWKD